eukprot:940694-Pyramimonas_sp.AAC.2
MKGATWKGNAKGRARIAQLSRIALCFTSLGAIFMTVRAFIRIMRAIIIVTLLQGILQWSIRYNNTTTRL